MTRRNLQHASLAGYTRTCCLMKTGSEIHTHLYNVTIHTSVTSFENIMATDEQQTKLTNTVAAGELGNIYWPFYLFICLGMYFFYTHIVLMTMQLLLLLFLNIYIIIQVEFIFYYSFSFYLVLAFIYFQSVILVLLKPCIVYGFLLIFIFYFSIISVNNFILKQFLFQLTVITLFGMT